MPERVFSGSRVETCRRCFRQGHEKNGAMIKSTPLEALLSGRTVEGRMQRSQQGEFWMPAHSLLVIEHFSCGVGDAEETRLHEASTSNDGMTLRALYRKLWMPEADPFTCLTGSESLKDDAVHVFCLRNSNLRCREIKVASQTSAC